MPQHSTLYTQLFRFNAQRFATAFLILTLSPAFANHESPRVGKECRWKAGPPVRVTDDEPVIEGRVVSTNLHAETAVVHTRYGFCPISTADGVRLADFSTARLLVPGQRVFLRPSELFQGPLPPGGVVADDLVKDHYLDLEGGKFANTNRQDLHHLFQSLEASRSQTLVVYFHGGLVDRRGALDPDRELQSVFRGAGAYPVFFVWNSLWKPLEPVLNFRTGSILLRLLRSRPYRSFLKKATRAIDDYEAARTTPGASAPLPEETISIPSALIAQGRAIGRLAHRTETDSDRGKDEQANLSAATETLWRDAVRHARERREQHRDHRGDLKQPFDATVIEEVYRGFGITAGAQGVWNRIKADTVRAFDESDPRSGGTAFLSELAANWTDGYRPRIVLVGHSAGAIYICHLLQACDRLGLPPDLHFDVVFLAPACEYNLFDSTMTQDGKRIAHFWVLGMSDRDESQDVLTRGLPWLYPESLLYFVSGVTEGAAGPTDTGDVPILGMQRYDTMSQYDNMPSVVAGRAFLAGHVTWTDSPRLPGGLAVSVHHHQDFKEDPCTLYSLQQIIEHPPNGVR